MLGCSIAALVLSLLGNLLVNLQNRIGFVIWIISNVFWIVVNFLGTPNYPQILMYLCYIILNTQGFLYWKKKNNK